MWRLNLRRGDSTVFFGKPELSNGSVPIPENSWKEETSGKRALFLIHGYNVRNAHKSYSEIERRIGDLYDVVIGVWWPGSDLALAFWLACMRADKAGKMLADCVRRMSFLSIDVEAHSLGCRVALEALRNGLSANAVILTAAAVDNESPLKGKRYYEACGMANVVFNAFSRKDPVLSTAYRLAKFDRALGLSGIANGIAPSSYMEMDFSHYVDGHGKYKTCSVFYHHWRRICS